MTATRDQRAQWALALGERRAGGWSLAPPRRLDALAGEKLGRRPGSSLEFEEYRDYHPGDDLRHLDWSVYGRSDRLVVRLFREEIQPHLDLLIDGSTSMTADGIGASRGDEKDAGEWTGHAKTSATLALAGFLAQAALAGGLTYQSWWASERGLPLAGSPAPPTTWTLHPFDHRGDLVGALSTTRWRRRGLRVVLSDLLFTTPAPGVVARLAEGAAQVVVVQVATREELRPTARGFARLEDLESGERLDLLIDSEAVAAYRRALEAHQAAWRQACQGVGALWLVVEAEALLEAWQSPAERTLGPFDELLRRGILNHSGVGAARS